jgi:hypothetical protein
MGFNKEIQEIFEKKFERAIENEFNRLQSASGVDGGLGSSR